MILIFFYIMIVHHQQRLIHWNLAMILTNILRVFGKTLTDYDIIVFFCKMKKKNNNFFFIYLLWFARLCYLYKKKEQFHIIGSMFNRHICVCVCVFEPIFFDLIFSQMVFMKWDMIKELSYDLICSSDRYDDFFFLYRLNVAVKVFCFSFLIYQ